MFNLIKYEWLRRWKLFLAGTIVFIATNLSLLNNIMDQAENPTTLTIILISLCFALSVILFIDHIGKLYRSLFRDESYLEFSVPLRGYQLLGGKIIAVIAECIAVITIITLTFYLDALYVAKVEAIPIGFGTNISFEEGWFVIQMLLMLLAFYMSFLLTVYLSMTLSKTVFASFKYGKLIAFGCFLAISKGIEMITQQIESPFDVLPAETAGAIFSGTDWLVTVAVIVVLFLSTSYLLDRRINL